MRLFAAISLPPAVRDHLTRALAMVSPPWSERNPWVPSGNLHITLGFYGQQPDGLVDELADRLRSSAGQTSRFELALAGAGTFRHDVCWVGVSDPAGALAPLAHLVRGSYALDDQHARSRFHVTVSRGGRRAGLESAMAALSVYRGPAWRVDQIGLYRSDLGEGVGGRSRYTLLATADLVP